MNASQLEFPRKRLRSIRETVRDRLTGLELRQRQLRRMGKDGMGHKEPPVPEQVSFDFEIRLTFPLRRVCGSLQLFEVRLMGLLHPHQHGG